MIITSALLSPGTLSSAWETPSCFECSFVTLQTCGSRAARAAGSSRGFGPLPVQQYEPFPKGRRRQVQHRRNKDIKGSPITAVTPAGITARKSSVFVCSKTRKKHQTQQTNNRGLMWLIKGKADESKERWENKIQKLSLVRWSHRNKVTIMKGKMSKHGEQDIFFV